MNKSKILIVILLFVVVIFSGCTNRDDSISITEIGVTTKEEIKQNTMILVEGGTFQMGSTIGNSDEQPVHQVTLSSYYISKYEVMVWEYRAFCNATNREMPTTPSWGWHDNDPIVNVSWNDAKAYCDWAGARLPSEAEWEFAAMGGKLSKGYKYSGSDNLDEVSWYLNNSGEKVHQVGSKSPNELGIYDMSGNAFEWCADWYGDFSSSSSINPDGAAQGIKKILRGGAWGLNGSQYGRTKARGWDKPIGQFYYYGFRVVMHSEIPYLNMIEVEGGTFQMGSTSGDSDEQPIHSVTVSSFYISKYEVTVNEYRAYCTAVGRAMPSTPNWGWNDNDPIVNVSWNDAKAYCDWAGVRLPTEAEWEYAARGGASTQGYTYSGSNTIGDVAWYSGNSNDKVHTVGTKAPNELGLYDMSGNVWEWCNDWYGSYSSGAQTDPTGPTTGSLRVLRGGSWYDYYFYCRSANRSRIVPDDWSSGSGFRVARLK